MMTTLIKNNFEDLNINELTSIQDSYFEQFEYLISDLEGIKYEVNSISSKLIDFKKDIVDKIAGMSLTIKEPLKVAVVGAQGSGKSTFVNLLLEEDKMISSGFQNEAGIIKLIYTEDIDQKNKVDINYYTEKPNVFDIETISYNKFIELIDLHISNDLIENEKYKDKVAFFEVYSDNTILKKVQIINTPGMNSITFNFYEKLKNLFIEADIIYWINNGNDLLDNFNKGLIEKIHRDNKNIIGIISNADKMYKMSKDTGIYDVIKQYLEELENNTLFRVTDSGCEKISLFVFNGLAAEIGYGIKPGICIKEKDNLIPPEKEHLKMLWNDIYKGFAFSDTMIASEILTDNNIINYDFERINIEYEKPKEYDQQEFIQFLIENKFIEESSNNSLVYTAIGKKLMLKMSQINVVKKFSEDNIFNIQINKKISNVLERFNNLYVAENIIGKIATIAIEYRARIVDLNKDYDEQLKKIEDFKEYLKNSFEIWSTDRINKNVSVLSNNLMKSIIKRIEHDIDRKKLLLEMWSQIKNMAYPIFGKAKETPIMDTINSIIEDETKFIIAEKIDDIGDNALKEIKAIVSEFKKEDLNVEIGEIEVDSKYTKKTIKIDSTVSSEHLRNLLKNFSSFLTKEPSKKIINDLFNKIIRTDLRRSGIGKLQKFFVKLFRKVFGDIFKKIGKKAGSKAIPVIGQLFLILDTLDFTFALDEIYKDIKISLKKSINENESEFSENIKNILKNIYEDVLKQSMNKIDELILSPNNQIKLLENNIKFSDEVTSILESYKLKINQI